jgi:hypothetical protein
MARIASERSTPLEHPSLTSFEPQLMMLVELAFGGGVRSLEAAGFKLGDDLIDLRAREHYRNGLHRSFAQAQNEIGQIVLKLGHTGPSKPSFEIPPYDVSPP